MNAGYRLPLAAVCIAAIAGCASVTSGIAFQPPSGWTGTPAMFGHFQMWMKSGQQKGSAQMLMLVRGDVKNTRTDLNALPPQLGNDMRVVRHGSVMLCGGTQPAQEYVAVGTDRNGKRSQMELTSTVIGSDRYVAMYVRPLNTPADPQAEAATRSLCPVK